MGSNFAWYPMHICMCTHTEDLAMSRDIFSHHSGDEGMCYWYLVSKGQVS